MKALLEQDDFGGLRIAPLIDVVFLLLIFFLVATTFYQEEKDLTLRLADATEGREPERSDRVIVVNVRESGVIVVNQRVQTLAQLEGLLGEAYARNPQVAVIVRCDRHAYHQEFVGILNLCEKVGIGGVAVATFQTAE